MKDEIMRETSNCSDLTSAMRGGLAVFSLALTGCSGNPEFGAEIKDDKLVAILKPEGSTEARLFKTADKKCYFVAKGVPLGFSARDYQAMLEERGVEIVVGGGSAHAPLSVSDAYTFRFIREAEVKPYTVETKEIIDSDPRDRSFFRSLFGLGYRSPIDKGGTTITLRLGEGCSEPWLREVLVPEEDVVPLPYGLPRPPGALVYRAALLCGTSEKRPIAQKLPEDCFAFIDMVSRVPVAEMLDEAAAGLASSASTSCVRKTKLICQVASGSALRLEGVRWFSFDSDTPLMAGGRFIKRDVLGRVLPGLPEGV